MIIYRPYINIEKSIKCLNKRHCFQAVLNSYLLLTYIYEQMRWFDGTVPAIIVVTNSFKHYFNNGKPYIKELITYHEIAQKIWLSHEGTPTDYISGIKKLFHKISKHCANDSSNWSKEKALEHKQLLLQIDEHHYKIQFKKKKKWKF